MFKGEERIFHLSYFLSLLRLKNLLTSTSAFVQEIFNNNLEWVSSRESRVGSPFEMIAKPFFGNRIWYAQVYPLILLCAVQEMRSIYNDRYKRRAKATHTNNIYFRSRMVGNAVRDRFLCNKHMIYRMVKLISQL
jgi:hypothetical protein